jgi:predicted RNase H-like HicB family nuclease
MKPKTRKATVQHAGHLYTVVLEPDDGGYHGFCPALKGCHTCGETAEETMANIREAVSAFCGSLVKHGEPLPDDIALTRETKSKELRAKSH